MAASVPVAESDTLDLPIIELGHWFDRAKSEDAAKAAAAEAARVAESLHLYGLLIVRDPRANEKDNDVFLNMLERYFEQPEEEKNVDVRKELHYQVGATPSRVELPRDHCDRMKAFVETDKPLSLCPPEKDPKWRFFWKLGERPAETEFPELNAAPVIPKAFPEWTEVMNTWGSKLLDAVQDVAEMAAEGFGLPADTFRSRMRHAPHLLAPTASDFNRFGAKGTVLAGFHYDLNALTIHGRSRYPGLYVWTRDGRKKGVKIPAGCLLVQAGKQMEYVTGGHVLAGFHEVVVNDGTVAAIDKARAEARSLWRISSTCFAHFASDTVLEPLGRFSEMAGAKDKYPPIKTGAQVAAELAAIALAPGGGDAIVAM